jgi:hypothetical protein
VKFQPQLIARQSSAQVSAVDTLAP